MGESLARLALPAEVTAFERAYLGRTNRLAIWLLCALVPIITALSALSHNGIVLPVVGTAVLAALPLILKRWLSPRMLSKLVALIAVAMGAFLVHAGEGPAQVEMHFYFFALIAILPVFANPSVILIAAAGVALHQAVGWWIDPAMIFDKDSPGWILAVHGVFILLDTAAACFVAREFFDKVIDLEHKVAQRTQQVEQQNFELRLLLDNLREGFFFVDRSGKVTSECSAIVATWLGPIRLGESFFDALTRNVPEAGEASRLAWSEVNDGIMPLVVTLSQMPSSVMVGERQLRIEYRAIGEGENVDRFLVVIEDITSEAERERLSTVQQESMSLIEAMLRDRRDCLLFVESTGALVAGLPLLEPKERKRGVHTLKGNSAAYGLESLALLCHEIEESDEDRQPLLHRQLEEHWRRIASPIRRLLEGQSSNIEVPISEHMMLEEELKEQLPYERLLARVSAWTQEPTENRLSALATQARALATKLGKRIEVRTIDNGIRLDPDRWRPFWASIIHALRNAVDHGLEPADVRLSRGKPEVGMLDLETKVDRSFFVVTMKDDGNGIDFVALRRKAKEMNLRASTDIDLIFASGVSTATEVSHVSGRGVGMDALRTTVHKLGGTIEVSTERGRGTTFRFVFPAASMSRAPGRVLQGSGKSTLVWGDHEDDPGRRRLVHHS